MRTMEDIYCIRCESLVPTVDLTTAEKHSVAAIYRQQGPMAAIKQLTQCTRLSLVAAKSVVLHLTPQPHYCHRCNYQELEAGEALCPQCKSINLNW